MGRGPFAAHSGVAPRRKKRLARRVERRQYRRHARPIPPRLISRPHRALADHRRHRGGLVWHRRADSVARRELSGTGTREGGKWTTEESGGLVCFSVCTSDFLPAQ